MGYQIRQILSKTAAFAGKMQAKWLICWSICPPFVKITKYRPENKVYVIDTAKTGPVWDTKPLDLKIDTSKNYMDYLSSAVYRYYLPNDPTAATKITNID